MKLSNIFGKRIEVAEDFYVRVSRHFSYSTFGVRGRYENVAHTGNYICSGTPGTGFFAHNSDSHSYRRHVLAARENLKQNFLTLLLKKEPDFEKENARIEKALENCDNIDMKRMLASYQNVISLAKEEELMQRIVRAIKDKMGEHRNKFYVSVLSHYKSAIATLEHDVRSAQIIVSKNMSEEQLQAWQKVIDAFHLLVESRRVWSVFTNEGSQAYKQVFFDMGIFDYIQSPHDTPVMRDHKDIHYYVYPTGIVRARSSVDFDLFKWEQLSLYNSVVDINTLAIRPEFNSRKRKHKHHHSEAHMDAIGALYGTTRAQVVGEISIPELELRFFVNHTGPAQDFVAAVHEYLKIK